MMIKSSLETLSRTHNPRSLLNILSYQLKVDGRTLYSLFTSNFDEMVEHYDPIHRNLGTRLDCLGLGIPSMCAEYVLI